MDEETFRQKLADAIELLGTRASEDIYHAFDYVKKVADRPNDSATLGEAAMILALSHPEFDDAFNSFALELGDRAVELAPNDADAHFLRGQTFEFLICSSDDLDLWMRAYEEYKIALSLDPDHADANQQFAYKGLDPVWSERAGVQHSLERALDYNARAISARPGDWHLWETRGGFFESAGDHASAIIAYEKALELCPEGRDEHLHNALKRTRTPAQYYRELIRDGYPPKDLVSEGYISAFDVWLTLTFEKVKRVFRLRRKH